MLGSEVFNEKREQTEKPGPGQTQAIITAEHWKRISNRAVLLPGIPIPA